MANNIVSQSKDFAEWYTSVTLAAKLITYANCKGCVNYLPHGWAIWEQIQKYFNEVFLKLKIQNVQLPLFINMSDFGKEKKHIEGFAPEAFIVNKKGNEVLTDPYILRPTSEVAFSQLFKDIIKSYNDLPLKYNQWCSVYRAEKTTKPFLRGSEFFWHELHCMFNNQEEAMEYPKLILKEYERFYKEVCNIATLIGKKTEGEKFAGAVDTYTIEVWSKDNQCIQSCTSHYLGTNFSKMYNVQFQDKDNAMKLPHYTSHGLSTRSIGAIIVNHGDDKGLVLPFLLAPVQIAILTLFSTKDKNVLKTANSIAKKLKKYRVSINDDDSGFGFKISNEEIKGTPISIVIGPNDVKSKSVVLIRRDNSQKYTITIANLVKEIKKHIDEYGKSLYSNSLKHLNESIVNVRSEEEFANALKNNKIALAPWGGDINDEVALKKKYAISPRVIAKAITTNDTKCFFTKKTATNYVYFARAY